METTKRQKSRRFHLLRFLLVLSLKDIFKSECARQYILGDTVIAEDIREFEEWRYRRYCSRMGIRIGNSVTASQAPPSGQ